MSRRWSPGDASSVSRKSERTTVFTHPVRQQKTRLVFFLLVQMFKNACFSCDNYDKTKRILFPPKNRVMSEPATPVAPPSTPQRKLACLAVVLSGEPNFWLCVPRNKRHTTTFDWSTSLCSWIYPSELIVKGGHPDVPQEEVQWYYHARGETSLIQKYALLAVTELYELADPRDPLGEKKLYALPKSEEERMRKLFVDFLSREAEKAALGLIEPPVEAKPKREVKKRTVAPPPEQPKEEETVRQLSTPMVHYSRSLGHWCLLKEVPLVQGTVARGSRVLRELGSHNNELWLLAEGGEPEVDLAVGAKPNCCPLLRELELRDVALSGSSAGTIFVISSPPSKKTEKTKQSEKKVVADRQPVVVKPPSAAKKRPRQQEEEEEKSLSPSNESDEDESIAHKSLRLPSLTRRKKVAAPPPAAAPAVTPAESSAQQEEAAMLELLEGIEHARKMETLIKGSGSE